MAIYKPTDCSPFNGTFDLSSDLPIIFECKIDTSNSPVTGYSIEIYNSNNEIIFPGVNRTTGPIKSNVTYLTDLKKYVQNKFPSLVSNIRNVNSGLNGTVLEIPAIVNNSDVDDTTTVGRNQIGIISGETNILVDGQTYTWKITLYQEVRKGNNVSTTTDDSIFPPNDEKYYDMTVTSGTVIGSNEKRIQTALIDSDDKVVDNLVLIDKFVQPIKINGFDEYDPTNPVKSWTGTVPTTFTMARSLITGYDSTYGYVYPSTAEGNAFTDGQIVPENANGFQIFKNGNNTSNLGATDMVEFIYGSEEFNGKMTWKTSAAKPEQSYWEQIYLVDSDPGGVFYPLKGDGYSSFALTGSERIVFNNIQDSKVQYSGIYYGSPYNGIFKPHFSFKENAEIVNEKNTIHSGIYSIKENPAFPFEKDEVIQQGIRFCVFGQEREYSEFVVGRHKGINTINYSFGDDEIIAYLNRWGDFSNKYIEIKSDVIASEKFYDWFIGNITPVYQVTVIWNRDSDAANWGTLSNKIIYCRRDGKNYEINTTTQVGEINKTPFKFVEEKPVRIFNTATVETQNQITGNELGNNSRIFNTSSAISSILSVTNNSGVDITKDCAFEVGKNYIIYTSSSTIPSNLTISVKYIPFNIQDYTGIIFYNKQAISNQDTGIIYIRPSININQNMIFKEVTTTAKPTWFNINYFNKDYNYITYTGNQGFSPEIDKTRYQIKSFYKDSDYNPFSIYKNPEIVSTISGNIINSDEFTNAITTRNFTVTSTYDQNSYIQWKSYQWILYDSAKRTILEKTDERYDGEITATFYGLDPQKYYILSLILQTNTGKIIEIDYVIYSDFTETVEQRDLVEVAFDCDTLSMKANLKLVNTVIAPDADEYLSGTATTNPTKDTVYYYDNKDNFYQRKNNFGNYETVASVNENDILKIQGQNSLSFSKSYSNYKTDDKNVNIGEIQTNADEIVLEGAFTFSDDYNGNIFSISRDDSLTATIEISIPQALMEKDSDGFVNISSDIDKIKIKSGSYLKIIGNTDKISDIWQDSIKFHNTSIWKKVDQIPSGNRINVANFKYAEVDFVNQNGIPYPYEKGAILETINGENIIWNQLLDKSKFHATTTIGGVTFTNNRDGTIAVNGTARSSDHIYYGLQNTMEVPVGHKILISGGVTGAGWSSYLLYDSSDQVYGIDSPGGGKIYTVQKNPVNMYLFVAKGYTVPNITFKPQLFDLTQMFGAGNEPATPEEFWSYFETNKVYFKNTYLNIVGPYNSYDETEPLKNPMNPAEQKFSFMSGDDPSTDAISNICSDGSFYINQPDRLIWLDYIPTDKQKMVVIDADSNQTNPTTQPMTVMENELLIWPENEENICWKDGVYVESGREKTLIGQIFVNGDVVKSEYLNKIHTTYSSSGLTQQIQIPQNINERKEISNYEFAFRIFVNTNNFSVDKLRSRCYVKKIS